MLTVNVLNASKWTDTFTANNLFIIIDFTIINNLLPRIQKCHYAVFIKSILV